MSYTYTNGDGVAVLLVTEPNGATEPISVLDDAIRQIKAYLNDPIAGPEAKIAALANAVTPAGTIRTTAVNTIPTGWLDCDGAAVSRTTYATLFAAIGVTFGAGDASTTFNVPDCRGRALVGMGTGDATDATAWSLAQKKGAETHTLASTEIPSHTHFGFAAVSTDGTENTLNNTSQVARQSVNIGDQGLTLNRTATSATVGLTSATGSGSSHNNIQPSLAVRVIIKT